MKNKEFRRISAVVTCGYKSVGRVIDKLVREKMIEMKGSFKDEWIS